MMKPEQDVLVGAQYDFDDDPARLDRDAVWTFLSTEATWGRSRTRADVERQLDGAWRVVGAYEAATGRLVGFSRALSDGVSFAYLDDLFVITNHRGRGVAAGLVRKMVDDGPGTGFRWLLDTEDAARLYVPFGFGAASIELLERAPSRHY